MEQGQSGGGIEKGLVVLWVIWGAMVLSLFVYLMVCHQFGDEIRKSLNPDIRLDRMRHILFVVTAGELVLIYLVRRGMVPTPLLAAGRTYLKAAVPTVQPGILARYTTALIISLALSESIGLYGLVLYFLGDTLQVLYTFVGISAAAMFYFRPKKVELEGFVMAMQEKSGKTQPH